MAGNFASLVNTLNRFAAFPAEAIAPSGGSRDGDELFAQTGALPPLFGEFILAESLILASGGVGRVATSTTG
jgi:hypothetical protein